MAPHLLLFAVSSSLAERGDSAAWVWQRALCELVALPPGSACLLSDDKASEAFCYAAAIQVGVRRISLRWDGTRHSSPASQGPTTWGGKGAARARAIVDLAVVARDQWGYQPRVCGLVAGQEIERSETARKLAMARAEGLPVETATFPGAVVVPALRLVSA